MGLAHRYQMPSVLLVCLGNICRSPSAEAVFRAKADRELTIESAGTGAWHAGEPPDSRARAEGERRGYSFAGQQARAVQGANFYDFDLILAMDATNLRDLKAAAPKDATARLALFRPDGGDVPDPYYGGPQGFADVFDLLEASVEHWLEQLRAGP